jgi:hypothetical protein
VTTPFGDFGAPPDAIAWVSLLLAAVALVVALLPSLAEKILRLPERRLVVLLAVGAAALSAVYVHAYLRGGPRIIDATTYYLQARTLSEGRLAALVPSPTGSFRGRFLLASPDGHELYGLFPPGYPAILAVGFALGAPLAVGPLLAMALVAVTYGLALRVSGDKRTALLAAALSATSAVLRYHTADTMSHGWAAMLFGAALWASLGTSRASALFAGASLGWLVATRPVTGAVAFAVALAAAFTESANAPATPGLPAGGARFGAEPSALVRALLLVAGALGPIALFFVEQRAATGQWLRSSQLAYYALADGPPGCFRYGFGSGVGCVFEHGDFVRARLAHGYGLVAALGTTLRRLKMHLADAGNSEVFAPILAWAIAVAVRTPRIRLAAVGVLGTIGAYAPFYFDGNYPGGGARLFADVLPLEHVLIAAALARLGLSRFALPVAFAGFALHTAYDHGRLAAREGGRPLFERETLRRARVERGLVFVDTDHGFDLGFDPLATPKDAVVVARFRHDAHDALLWDRLGRPMAHVYEQPLVPGAAAAQVTPLTMTLPTVWRFEAEAEWPPLAVAGGSVEPVFPPCASSRRALALHPSPGERLRVRLEAPSPSAARYRIATAWVTPASGRTRAQVTRLGISWEVTSDTPPGGCQVVEGPLLQLSEQDDFIDISVDSAQVLDYVELAPEGAR